MAYELIKSSARIFGGSAVAGMGLSFGRDIYRGATSKDKKNAILGFLIIALAFFGTYIGGVWLARNYETLWGSLFKRIGALFILAPSFMFLLFLGIVLTAEPENVAGQDAENFANGPDRPTLMLLSGSGVIMSNIKLRWEDDQPFMDMADTNGGEGWSQGSPITENVWSFSQNKFYSITLDFNEKTFIESGFDGAPLEEVKGSWQTIIGTPEKENYSVVQGSLVPETTIIRDENGDFISVPNEAAIESSPPIADLESDTSQNQEEFSEGKLSEPKED